VTTGEGGAVLTNNDALHARLLSLRSHGITRDAAKMERESDGPWYYEMVELGFNYRITDIQAALGVSQLARLDAFIERRRALARRYTTLLGDLPLVLPQCDVLDDSAWHLYVVRMKLDATDATHCQVFERLRHAGIGVNLHYIPVHLHPYYRRLGFAPGQFPEAEQYYREAISLPMYAGLTDEAQSIVAHELRKALT